MGKFILGPQQKSDISRTLYALGNSPNLLDRIVTALENCINNIDLGFCFPNFSNDMWQIYELKLVHMDLKP